ncbi:putative toxin-antitoxin system antitoxin component (TIGR02293 family) [Endobacter medicaginis]|uniref:DUF2384 domain-containing protein n=1 Tax=Endobacter medicaginis TaxID=1181271 RepID=A0A850NU24_9PROT|nr:antitoxin Xre/MbcA/ParS toxin-binding domain-containing protein [Endobacter medicaginis]MBB3172573.1 putative toxin-antitoxin system antitoxin component (TIGR02293 family) [Endobacter medicaginis]MCX5475277.1 DUF2384 domain-containing protein [Endobacter medicaginis]NVN30932.1 DUF2384 domain-containing protein [Endobacter medicaginis]
MSAALEYPLPEHDPFDRAVGLLGGERHLGRRVSGPMDVHDVILEGMPSSAAVCLFAELDHLKVDRAMENAVGFSLRTFQRRRGAPERMLTREQGGKLWLFAEILALASDVLGTQDAAERWLETPAIALERHRPLDLLATPAGTEMVRDLLGRMRTGVYT